MRYGAIGLLVSLAGCSNPLDITLIALNVEGPIMVSRDAPGDFRVTAENTGSERIAWGHGSSSCQLGLGVLVDGVRQTADFRGCTADLVEQGLDPGETRTEIFQWGGEIAGGTLPDGQYRLVGIAGDQEETKSVQVTVTNPRQRSVVGRARKTATNYSNPLPPNE